MKKILSLLILLSSLSAKADAINQSTIPVVLTSSLLAALISAGVSAFVAVRLKDKEYKNDFYKKVLEKRLKAIEAAEAITSTFMLIHGVGKPIQDCHSYFVDGLDSNRFSDTIDAASQYNFWYSGETQRAVGRLTLAVIPIEKAAKKLQADGASRLELREFAIEHYDKVDEAVQEVGMSLAKDMSRLDDVERFFKSKLKGLPR